MKICLINSLFKPYSRGGAETIAARQAAELRDQGHEVFVITTNVSIRHPERVERVEGSPANAGPGTSPETSPFDPAQGKLARGDNYEMVDGVKVCCLNPRNIFTFYEYNQKPLLLRLIWLKIDLMNCLIARAALKIIRQENPEVIYTHNLRGLSYLLLRKIKKAGIKNIHTLHDIQYVYPSGLLIHGEEGKWYNRFFARRMYEAWCRYWLGSPDEVIAPSQWLMDFYASRGFFKDSKKKVVRPFSHYERPQGVEESPANAGFGGVKIIKPNYDKPVKLVYIGGIEKHKGILWAAETLKNSNMEFKLEIYGKGTKVKQLKDIIKDDDRFDFHGELPHEKVGEIFARADISLMPTLTYENAPTVIYESIQARTPVLASKIGGIPEIINDNNGWLFEPGNEADFLNKLKQII